MAEEPLAQRMRPKNLSEVVGQEHLTAVGGVLHKVVASGKIHSFILWGPPGVGKTTLAQIVAEGCGLPFRILSAISSGVKDLREVIKEAEDSGKQIVVFIDEIHRFSKSQQDALLGAVEKGTIVLIGATTENPSFEVNKALLSRCRVYTLKQLDEAALGSILQHALASDAALAGLSLSAEALQVLLFAGSFDGRKTLNILELASNETGERPAEISKDQILKIAEGTALPYDKNGDYHYDIISAFIKSIRGSDVDAGLYWLARMIGTGESPEFIARRLLILAAEDIGNANPNALLLANTTFDAVQKIGWPESRIILAQCVVYLAMAEKSNASYLGIGAAEAAVRETGDLPVPLHLRNAPTKLSKEQGYGAGYLYPHNYAGGLVAQEYLPTALKGRKLFEPGNSPKETEMIRKLEAAKANLKK